MQSNFAIALIIFLLTYSAIIYSNVKNKGYPIWLIMGIGALAMVLSGVLRVDEAYSSINLRVIVFLFSMLVFASALEISGAIEMFATYMLSRARTPNMILLMILLGIGLLSSILMNDTLALIGTPLVIELSKKMKISPKPLLITLAFSVTIGSVMTPIGNPQNLLIAIESGIKAPFIFFLYFLAVPTILNIFLTYFLISKYFSNYMKEAKTNFRQVIEFDVKTMKLKDEKLAKLSIATLVFTILFILVVNTLELLGISFEFQISEISLIGALILLALSNKRRELILRLDWSVLLLFASLFVLIQGVWNGGVIAFFASYLPDL
ncbi:MAG TPA: SLC13 family permease, partial [Geobacterales bacterium]|nr:SLC13 family permease [Geobacterales bacterium]